MTAVWDHQAGGEMLSTAEMLQAAVDFADTYHVDPRTVVVNPWGYAPLCMPPIPTNSGIGRLHPGMDLALCTHPVFWLEDDTRRPLAGEHPWEWVLRVYLELRARELVDTTGAWADALAPILDLSKAENRRRLERYRDGKFDPLLSRHIIPRSDDLRFDEARLAARQMYDAHRAQFVYFLKVEREEARLAADAHRTWIGHAPKYWELRLNDWRRLASELLAAAQQPNVPPAVFSNARRLFSDASDATRQVLGELIDHTHGVEAAVSANVHSWGEHVASASGKIESGIDAWEEIYEQVEVATAAVYAHPDQPDRFGNLDRLFCHWWEHLHKEADTAVEQMDHLVNDGRFYPPPKKPGGELEIVVGRERFRHVDVPPLPAEGTASLN